MKRIIIFFVLFSLFLISSYAGDIHSKADFRTGLWIKNQGQMPSDILYYCDSSTGRVYVRKNDIVIQEIEPVGSTHKETGIFNKKRKNYTSEYKSYNSYIRFPGISLFDISEEKCTDTKINIFKTGNRDNWISNISTYRTLRIRNIGDGTDILLEASSRSLGTISADDPGMIANLDIEAEGESLPFFRIVSNGEYIGDYDTLNRSIIKLEEGIKNEGKSDPAQMIWGTFLGGALYDHCAHIALDSGGNILIAGITESADIPVPNGLYTSYSGEIDMYFAKLNPDGNDLIWATYIGGTSWDDAISIIADSGDNIIVYGETSSTDIPLPGAMDDSLGGESDFYLAKISPAGDSMIWGTYLGGSGIETYALAGNCLALDSNDNIVFTGATDSVDIPTPNGYDDTMGDDYIKMYIAKINSAGTEVMWGTYLGGNSFDYGISLDLDSSENVVVGGCTVSDDMPVPGGYDTVFNGNYDMYIAKLTSDGTDLLWGTYLGGTNNDECYAVKCDSSDNIIIGGDTQSIDIPVPNGIITAYLGGYFDFYAAKLNSTGSQLLWGTFLGGEGLDICYGMALDPDDNAVLMGSVGSGGNVLTPDGFDTEYNGGEFDMYSAIVSSAGDELLWASFIGGNNTDMGYAVNADLEKNIIIAGDTTYDELNSRYDIIPTPNGYDQTYNGSGDIYIAKIKAFKDGPDASVLASDMGFSPSDPMPGDTVILSARVYNLGDTGIESGNCSFYYSMEPGIDLVLIGTQAFGMLAPGDYVDISQNWVTDPGLIPDTYIITAVLDDITPDDYNLDNDLAYIEMPLPVDLGYFMAIGIADFVNISWMTVSEADNLGFNLYRLNLKKLSPFVLNMPVKLNDCLIEGSGTTPEPSYYSYTDNVKNQGNYLYILESVSAYGETKQYTTRVNWIL